MFIKGMMLGAPLISLNPCHIVVPVTLMFTLGRLSLTGVW